MRLFTAKFLVAGIVLVAAASAQAYQFGTFSNGTYTLGSNSDTETVTFEYFNGHANIPLDTLFLDGNSQTGSLSGPGGVDVLNFNFHIDNNQTLGSQQNEEISWQSTTTTGAFSGYTGLGSISIDFSFSQDGSTAQTASGLTGELNPVPEPASLAALGIGALALVRRRRKA